MTKESTRIIQETFRKNVSDSTPLDEGKGGAMKDAWNLVREAKKLGGFQNSSKAIRDALKDNQKRVKEVRRLKDNAQKIMVSYPEYVRNNPNMSDRDYPTQDALEDSQHEIFKVEMTLLEEKDLLWKLSILYQDWERKRG